MLWNGVTLVVVAVLSLVPLPDPDATVIHLVDTTSLLNLLTSSMISLSALVRLMDRAIWTRRKRPRQRDRVNPSCLVWFFSFVHLKQVFFWDVLKN